MVRSLTLLTVMFAWLAVVSLPGTTSASPAPPAIAPPPEAPALPPAVLDISPEALLGHLESEPVAADGDPPPAAEPEPRVSAFEETRIVSVYGYPGICFMGELGCHDPQLAATRAEELAVWYADAEDGHRPQPAFHLIVDVAQPLPGADGSYLSRMALDQIEDYVEVARERGLLLFLDLQIGWTDPLEGVQRVGALLEEPFVHLALDPEFATRERGLAPGEAIGTLRAAEVNRAQEYLAAIVQEHHLPPKMLVLHQFTPDMLPDKQDFEDYPEVDVTVDMDGYGGGPAKISGYEAYARVGTEFSAFKLFFEWDTPLLTPEEVLALPHPPDYIIYQ
ncbi:MAG: hypothetical protein WD734_03220 [Dehalococcoidia bacterium]